MLLIYWDGVCTTSNLRRARWEQKVNRSKSGAVWHLNSSGPPCKCGGAAQSNLVVSASGAAAARHSARTRRRHAAAGSSDSLLFEPLQRRLDGLHGARPGCGDHGVIRRLEGALQAPEGTVEVHVHWITVAVHRHLQTRSMALVQRDTVAICGSLLIHTLSLKPQPVTRM